jgi:hypothetical protein
MFVGIKMNKLIVAVLMSGLALPVAALEKISGNPDWSGFWNLGVGVGYTESNFLARIAGVDIDLGDDTINDFGSPDDESYANPVVGFQFAYTMDNDRTHFIFGNDTGDELQFERDMRVAIQHDFEGVGSMRAAFFTSSALETEVWSDPYLVGESRDDTEQSSSGGRFIWDQIMGTGFELEASFRSRDIDKERSGEALGLTDAERQLLNREGDITRVEVGFLKKFGDRHALRPSVTYIDRDLDGGAMAQDGFALDLGYTYTTKEMRWVSSIGYASLDGDKVNPIFADTNDADRITISSQMFFPGGYRWKNWMPALGVLWGQEDSDINFNDTKTWAVRASVYRNF